MKQQKKAIIIGAGIGGLATAALLGKKGYAVTVLEKNARVGGRANLYSEDGFVFDMGPSWYMMPDIFEHFFELMGEDIKKYLKLKRLSPSYRIFLKSEKKHYDFYSDLEKTIATFESLEPGSGEVLREYMKTTDYQYHIARDEFMFKNYDSIFDFLNKRVMTEGRKLPMFSRVQTIINGKFKSEILRKVMQYQTVLLGTAPGTAPGIYSMMNYVDFVEGVWYPDGGIYKIVEALEAIAKKNGVEIRTNAPVAQIRVGPIGNKECNTSEGDDADHQNNGGKAGANGVILTDGTALDADLVVSNADIVFTDQTLLEPQYREKSPRYWNKRLMAPSAFILYLGVDGEIPSLEHHNLVFAENWDENFKQIFNKPAWPNDPSMYICAPSKSDPTVAPAGKENLFVLVPIAAGLEYTDAFAEQYSELIIQQMEEYMDIPNLAKRIVYKRIYAVHDFIKDYNAFKGSALGLAHSLGQTAIFRPNNINKKVKNLYYVGAGTNPGIGMPICLISAELAYKRIEGITDPAPLKNI
jgi:phytoene desaturase